MWNANALTLSIIITILLIANVWVFPSLMELPAASDSAPQSNPAKPAPSMNGAGVVQGQLLKIEGEVYVVKDASGKQVRVRVNKETVLDRRIKVGDKIDAQISADGHAATVLKALE